MMDRNSYLGLLRMDEVRDELQVTEEQGDKIREAGDELRDSIQPPDVDFSSLRDGTPEERRETFAKMREFSSKVEKEARAKLAGILDETQMKRLRGLWVQRVGTLAALSDKEIAAELKLSEDQQKALASQQDDQRGRFGFGGGRRRGEGGPPPGAGGGEGGDRRERFEQMQQEAEEKALGVLTDEQKTAYAEIKGDEFEFPQREFRGRRGRGADDDDGPRRGRRGGPQRDAA